MYENFLNFQNIIIRITNFFVWVFRFQKIKTTRKVVFITTVQKPVSSKSTLSLNNNTQYYTSYYISMTFPNDQRMRLGNTSTFHLLILALCVLTKGSVLFFVMQMNYCDHVNIIQEGISAQTFLL